MATSAAKEKWNLIYDQVDFASFEQQLMAELITEDRANRHLLFDKYLEAELPEDPIRKFETSLTPQQKTTYDAGILAANIAVPTKLQVLEDPEGETTIAWKKWIVAQVAAGGGFNTAAKLKIYTDAETLHLNQEMRIWKLCMRTLLKTKRLMKRAPTGAGRQLLRIMRDDNRLNVTEKDSEELFDQFMAFRMQAQEFEDVELYHIRLKSLKHDIETAKKDPQPISDRFHRRIYVTGLRCYPLYDTALNEITKLE